MQQTTKVWIKPTIFSLGNSNIQSGNGMNAGAEYIQYCNGTALTTFTWSGNGNGPAFMGIDVGQDSAPVATPSAIDGVCS